jgi:type VI secretion system protein ImpE
MEATPSVTDARSLLRAEGPRAALERLKQEVRKAPRDARLRTFLFQLFCVFADWDRALNQLTVAAELDPLALPMAQAYRAAIRCEMLRERVFAGTRTPTMLGAPDAWMSLLIEANRVLATGDASGAAGLRDAAFEAAPTVEGTITAAGLASASPFVWIADADQRLGPMLEAFIDGKYYWVPFTRLGHLEVEAPADLRDHVWMPAHFTWANGGQADGFIPTRYPGSAQADEALAWSRRTEWRESGDWYLGLGQRMLTTDADEVALMDLRSLDITAPAEPVHADAGADASTPEPPTEPATDVSPTA